MRVPFNAFKNNNETDGGSSYVWPYPSYTRLYWIVLLCMCCFMSYLVKYFGFLPGYVITLILI